MTDIRSLQNDHTIDRNHRSRLNRRKVSSPLILMIGVAILVIVFHTLRLKPTIKFAWSYGLIRNFTSHEPCP